MRTERLISSESHNETRCGFALVGTQYTRDGYPDRARAVAGLGAGYLWAVEVCPAAASPRQLALVAHPRRGLPLPDYRGGCNLECLAAVFQPGFAAGYHIGA